MAYCGPHFCSYTYKCLFGALLTDGRSGKATRGDTGEAQAKKNRLQFLESLHCMPRGGHMGGRSKVVGLTKPVGNKEEVRTNGQVLFWGVRVEYTTKGTRGFHWCV